MSDFVLPVPDGLEGECEHMGTSPNVGLFIGDQAHQAAVFVVLLFFYLKVVVTTACYIFTELYWSS